MTDIRFRDFLRDRRIYIAVFLSFNLLTVAVVQLDLWFAGSTLHIGNVLYVGLLSVVGLAAWLTIDYRRQRAFYFQFAETLDERLAERSDEASLDEVSLLARPVTEEQALYADAWRRLYSRLRADLVAQRERNRRRIELITQWVHHMKTPVAVIDLELQKARRRESADSDTGLDESAESAAYQDEGTESGAHQDGSAHFLSSRPTGTEPLNDSEPTKTRHRLPPDEALLDSIAEENERLRHALHMLLNMIRLDDFAADFKIESVDLLAAVRDVINEHRRTFISHNVFPKIEQPSRCMQDSDPRVNVHSDAKWLKFALDQIVRNAIHYSARSGSSDPDGGAQDDSGHVVFRFDNDDDGTVLEIVDNGPGIRPEDIGRVFAPFFTGTGGREHRYATGMGLYLAKETCRKLGHDLSVHSELGKGTAVRLRFPTDTSLYADLRDATSFHI